LTAIAAVLLMVGMWVEVNSEWYWKATVVVSVYAVGCSHLSMLFLADLAPGYRWAYVVAYQLILGLATLLSAIAVFEQESYESGWRLTGALSILVAAITLLVPVFHYMSREAIAAAKHSDDPVCAVDEEIAWLKKRLIELESRRRQLLGREVNVGTPECAGQVGPLS
jgi:MFS family permease